MTQHYPTRRPGTIPSAPPSMPRLWSGGYQAGPPSTHLRARPRGTTLVIDAVYPRSQRSTGIVLCVPRRAAILELSKSRLRGIEIARILKVNRSTVCRAIQRGTMKDGVRPGRPISATTPRLIKIVKKRIQRNVKRSMRKMAPDLNVSERTIRRVVKEKVGMYPYKPRKRHGYIDVQKKGRHEKCKGPVKRAANGGHLTTLFTDEKLFVVEQCFNVQNVRVLAHSSSDADKKGRNVFRNPPLWSGPVLPQQAARPWFSWKNLSRSTEMCTKRRSCRSMFCPGLVPTSETEMDFPAGRSSGSQR